VTRAGAIAVFVLATAVLIYVYGWRDLWATPDQRGAWLLHEGRFAEAADTFSDTVWRGVALMRAGRFADAEQSFAQSDTPLAAYDRGNALVMLGKYPEAIEHTTPHSRRDRGGRMHAPTALWRRRVRTCSPISKASRLTRTSSHPTKPTGVIASATTSRHPTLRHPVQ